MNEDDYINEMLRLAGCQEELLETKPARYLYHLDKTKSFANISPERNNPLYEPVEGDAKRIDDWKRKHKQTQSMENNRKIEQFKQDVKSLGLSLIKTYGKWNEGGKQTNEQSFLIPNITKEQALQLGKKYGQYGIIFKGENDDTAYMYVTLDGENFGNKDLAFDMSNPSKFTQVKEPTREQLRKTSSSLRDYTGSTGLKPNGYGYQPSYKTKEEPK